MKVIIEPTPNGNRYIGKLFIDDEEFATVIDQRPGCCMRGLMNQVMQKYGKPTEPLTVTIDGW